MVGAGARDDRIAERVPTKGTDLCCCTCAYLLAVELVRPSLIATAVCVLAAALRRRTRTNARGELVGVLEERYGLVERHRRLLALLEQSALDLPELADLYYREARRSQVADLGRYIERRVRAGVFRPVPDPLTTARFVVEAIAWFAWHRRADADSAMIDDQTARATTIDMLATALLP